MRRRRFWHWLGWLDTAYNGLALTVLAILIVLSIAFGLLMLVVNAVS